MRLAAAKLFVKEGTYVFITGRRQKELDEAVTAIGSNVTGVQGDGIRWTTTFQRKYHWGIAVIGVQDHGYAVG